MSIFNELLELQKLNGEVIENLKSSVQGKRIFVKGGSHIIEPKDKLKRILSNGVVEIYEVIDPVFYEGGSLTHYEIEVKKVGIPDKFKPSTNVTFNISGQNARVNQNSIDNSTNQININPDMSKYMKELYNEIYSLKLTKDEEKSALEILSALESNINSKSPSKVVVESLLVSLPKLGNLASIGSFLLSCF